MKFSKALTLFITLFVIMTMSSSAFAQGPRLAKTDRTYASVGFVLNEFRSVLLFMDETTRVNGSFEISGPAPAGVGPYFPLTGQTYGLMTTLGTYITEHFKTELRLGTGFVSDTLKRSLEIDLDYWASWYMGARYPITDYASAYALYGVTHYQAEVTRKEVSVTYRDDNGLTNTITAIASPIAMEEDLFGTSFSTSWMLGVDFDLTKNLFLSFEYGRLLRDTDTGIRVYQAGTSLRYEF